MDQDSQSVPQSGLMRIDTVLKLIPVSRSNWWQGVKTGRYPAPVKLSERVTCWRTSDILTLIESAARKQDVRNIIADAEKGNTSGS